MSDATSFGTIDSIRGGGTVRPPACSSAPEVGARAQAVDPIMALVAELRAVLDIDQTLSDQAIVDGLTDILGRSDARGRWMAAFDSTLGHWLALQGRDLNTTINQILLALAPRRA